MTAPATGTYYTADPATFPPLARAVRQHCASQTTQALPGDGFFEALLAALVALENRVIALEAK